ncbi:hypothetical protein CAEBREN_32230 [Caenorhabditis brenneri]|uniref:HAT C-terminal dimerisation domain-containing protein n=1 Tax=Caenorhabditis brenneri TaxID=135651 RepID=G0MXY0_CAEBE|nr:hypothetical protein CAEBREN_32230 [Caenorhabditis brenneri]
MEDGDVELDVTYQVFQTGWQPSYDIRVDTETPSMTITYYGKLYNHCGEDWNEFSAVLSTAQPSLGGHIPELGTLDAHFYRPVQVPRAMHMKKAMLTSRRSAPMARGFVDQAEEEAEIEEEGMAIPAMAVPQMEVTQNALSTEFKISRKSNLANGTDDHKNPTDGAPISKTGRMISLPSYNENLTAEKEVSAFCTFIKRLSGVETEIVDWWSRHAARFPRLFKYAKEIYQIPACSIDAAYYLGEYGLLTYSLNEEEPSKRKMLLDASSELMENFRSKSELMCKQICVKRKRESNYPGDMWFNPVDLKAIQSCDPFEPTIIRKPELPKQSGITVPNISSMPLYNNRM